MKRRLLIILGLVIVISLTGCSSDNKVETENEGGISNSIQESNNTVIDFVTQNDEEVERMNEFVYMFDDRIISRYKVLHNATILRKRYGYLDQEMLMTSIVRNSFLTEEEFENIKDTVYNKGEKKL